MYKSFIVSILIMAAIIFVVEGLGRHIHLPQHHFGNWLPVSNPDRPARADIDQNRPKR